MDQNSYLIRLKTWILEGKYLFVFIILLFLPFILVKFEINETGLKIIGLILQIIGAIPLILSLKDKSLLFGKDQFFRALFKYIKRFPGKLKVKNIDISGLTSGISITSFDPRVKISPKENFQDIIRYFEEEVKHLDDRISKDYYELNIKIQVLTEKLDSFNHDLNKNLKELETKMLIVNVSNVSRDFFGIFTIAYGLILATIPDLMEKFYYWIF
jgi:hypothetical protein